MPPVSLSRSRSRILDVDGAGSGALTVTCDGSDNGGAFSPGLVGPVSLSL